MLTFVSTPLAHAKAPFNSAQPFELLLPPDAPLFPSLTALVIVSLSDNTGPHLARHMFCFNECTLVQGVFFLTDPLNL